MKRILPFVLVALAVAAAAVAANLLLLGYAEGRGDPVGRLSPVQPALTSPGTTTAPRTTTTAPTETEPEDDDSGRGRGRGGDRDDD